MYPPHTFLQLVIPRFRKVARELERRIWDEPHPLNVTRTVPSPNSLTLAEARKGKRTALKPGATWGKMYDQAWFRLEIPAALRKADDLYLHWHDQGEATLYVDGAPYAGFDVAHRFIRLPAGQKELWIEGFAMQTAIWHHEARGLDPKGCQFHSATLRRRHDRFWHLYHDWEVLLQLVLLEKQEAFPNVPESAIASRYYPPLNQCSVLLRRLLRGMDDAVNAWQKGGLEGMEKAVKAVYQTIKGSNFPPRAILTGHAHLDLVWLWPERMGEHKAVHTFSTVLRLMETYPEFRFSYSQPASYRAVERRAPEVIQQVKARMKSGQWEATGAMDVESDTQLACGEALARSFLIGQENFRALRGEPSTCCWLPDAFGYTACLPQIMAQTGVRYFFTTKLTWGTVNRFPFSSFVWRSPDGSEVLAHLTHEIGYNNMVNADELRTAMRAYQQVDQHDEFLFPAGFGDGGGGPTPEMCERARRMANLESQPRVQWDAVEPFFDRLATTKAQLPVWQGELYLEYHRGILTTHGELKSSYRKAERSLQTWEAAIVATGQNADTRPAWERVVFAQFHDYLPGSSIQEVIDEALVELGALRQTAEEKARQLLHQKGGDRALFNPLPYPRITYQKGEDKGYHAYYLPPLSGQVQTQLTPARKVAPVTAGKTFLENEYLRAEFNQHGEITLLRQDGRTVAHAEPLGQLFLFPDQPHQYDAWEIDRQTLSLGERVTSPAKVHLEQPDALLAILSFTRKVGPAGTVTIRYQLNAHGTALTVDYDIDWQDPQTLLKAVFPTAYQGTMARFGAPFGSTLRPQKPGPNLNEAQWESAGSRWATLSDDGERDGLALITEARYGFGCRDGILSVSLLRSALITGAKGDPNRPQLAHPLRRNLERRPTYSDLGPQKVRLGLAHFHADAPREQQPAALADLLFTGPLPYEGGSIRTGFRGLSGGDSLIPAWVKPADQGKGWILRLHETLGRRGQVTVELESDLAMSTVDLRENPVPGQQTGPREIRFTPYQIISLHIYPKE